MKFRAMRHSQLEHDVHALLEPDHSPPNEIHKRYNVMDRKSVGSRLHTLYEVCAAQIPVLTHITLAFKAATAQPFRRVWRRLDAAESE